MAWEPASASVQTSSFTRSSIFVMWVPSSSLSSGAVASHLRADSNDIVKHGYST